MSILVHRTTAQLRRKALQLLREYEATVCIVGPPDQQARRKLDAQRAQIQMATKNQLRSITAQLHDGVRALRIKYGIKAPSSLLLQLYEQMELAPREQFTLVPLYMMRELFNDYSKVLPDQQTWPPHARLGLDISGTLYDGARHPEVYLLEAIMFEDMATLFNLATTQNAKLSASSIDKAQKKRCNSLCRASLLASINFVEAYANGLAFDVIHEHGPPSTTTQSRP